MYIICSITPYIGVDENIKTAEDLNPEFEKTEEKPFEGTKLSHFY